MKVGLALVVRYDAHRDLAQAADELGYDSVWLPEHLIWPADLGAHSPYGDGHPPVDPTVPTLDALMWAVTLATATRRVRIGTYVYNLALRHPFVAARAVQTLDRVSGGRVELGVGAGWSPGEYAAVGVDFAGRGRRLDECIRVLRLLFTEPRPSFHGEFFSFDPVVFEPKPVQDPVPILVGGESAAALARAARLGDGWIGMAHTPATAADRVASLRALSADVTVTVGARVGSADDLQAFERVGVDRVIVTPPRGGVTALQELTERLGVEAA